jgi:serine phosphatase RsbU (regulator of sigma subunit)
LGLLADTAYGQGTMHFHPGNLILFHTDGVTPVRSAQEERFGKEWLERLLQEHWQQRALQVIANLARAVRAQTKLRIPSMTLLVC